MPHSAGERAVILQRLGLDLNDPASHAFAVAGGWVPRSAVRAEPVAAA
jgi:hypothetical protein